MSKKEPSIRAELERKLKSGTVATQYPDCPNAGYPVSFSHKIDNAMQVQGLVIIYSIPGAEFMIDCMEDFINTHKNLEGGKVQMATKKAAPVVKKPVQVKTTKKAAPKGKKK